MARTATVSEEQVAAVANGLLALGIAPTIRGVREKLGSGSMATVLKHYQTWQSKQARPTPIASTLPRDLERILLDFLGREVAASKGVVESELAAMQQANGDLIAESERQALTIDELTAELQEQSGEASRIAGRLVQVEADLASARTEFQAEREAAEHARTELAKAQLRLESMPRLEADLGTIRHEVAEERAGRTAAEQRAAVAEARYEAEKEARTKSEAMHQAAASQLLEVTTAIGNEKVANRIAAAHLDDKGRELQSAANTEAKLRAELSKAQQEAAELRGRLLAATANTPPISADPHSV